MGDEAKPSWNPPAALLFDPYSSRNSSGSFATLAAIRRLNTNKKGASTGVK
jgi:hypothetical protein